MSFAHILIVFLDLRCIIQKLNWKLKVQYVNHKSKVILFYSDYFQIGNLHKMLFINAQIDLHRMCASKYLYKVNRETPEKRDLCRRAFSSPKKILLSGHLIAAAPTIDRVDFKRIQLNKVSRFLDSNMINKFPDAQFILELTFSLKDLCVFNCVHTGNWRFGQSAALTRIAGRSLS